MTNTAKKIDYSVGFIGGGNMARSIIGGLVPEVLDSASVSVFDPSIEQLTKLKQEFNINICSDNHSLIEQCDAVVLATKPQIIASVLAPIAQNLTEKKPLLISIAAGVTVDLIQQIIDTNSDTTQEDSQKNSQLAIIRVMPNTPALVKSGTSGMYANVKTSNPEKEIAHTLMTAVGSAVWVDNESDIDTVTALSGSGPAYFMLFIQSLIDSAVNSGLSKEVAQQLAIDTCIGSAKLIQSSNDIHIEQLIKNVTSPGGTTEQALLSFQNDQLTHIIDSAFQAALKRSEELGKELLKKL